MGTTTEQEDMRDESRAPNGEPLRRPRLPGTRAWHVLTAICIVVILLVLMATPVLREHRTVKIGVIVPLTGSSSYLVDVRDGMLLAVEKLNRWGGINGAEIELLVMDSESDPAKALDAFQELENDDKPLFYVSAVGDATASMAQLAEESEVVLVALGASPDNLTDDRLWCVRYYPDTKEEVDATMHTLDVLGVSDLGILYASDWYSLAVDAALSEAFATSMGSVENCLLDVLDGDCCDEVLSLMDREAIVLDLTTPYMQCALTCLRENGYTGHILTVSAATSALVSTLSEGEGIYVAAPAIYNDNYLPAKWLTIDFEEHYGRPLTHYASCGYDIINLFSGLMRDTELTRVAVRHSIEGGFIYTGTTGILKLNPGSHEINFDLLSAVISEGRLWYL